MISTSLRAGISDKCVVNCSTDFARLMPTAHRYVVGLTFVERHVPEAIRLAADDRPSNALTEDVTWRPR